MTTLLSLVALWAMAVPAMAANYYALESLTANPASHDFETYAADSTLPTITITANALCQSATEAPEGYVTAKSISWKLDVEPASMKGTAAIATGSSTISKTSLKPTKNITGKKSKAHARSR